MRRRLNSRAFDPFDEWLESQGLYRKQVARDGSCLFRAVAEHVFMSQTEHVHVRSLCLAYMMLYEEDFQPFLEIPIDHHVFKLRDVREWGGHTEIIAMSRLFNFIEEMDLGILNTDDITHHPVQTDTTATIDLLLCSADSTGLAASPANPVVYDNLYTHVFQLKDVRLAVDTMLHDKEYASLRRDSTNSTDQKEIGALVEKVLATSGEKVKPKTLSVNEKLKAIEKLEKGAALRKYVLNTKFQSNKLNKYALKFDVGQEKSGIKKMRKVGNEDLEEAGLNADINGVEPFRKKLKDLMEAEKTFDSANCTIQVKLDSIGELYQKIHWPLEVKKTLLQVAEKGAAIEDVEAWLETDEDDPGFHNLTEEEIVDSVHEAADDFDDDEEKEDEPPKIKLP
ncbi:OTU domain-containing protein 4-like, partial [Homarus americanus]